MKKILLSSIFLLSFSAFAQQELRCAKAIASMAAASHDLGIYTQIVRAAETEAEGSNEDPGIVQAKISALKSVKSAKKAVFDMSVSMISVSCMSADMLKSGTHIKNEVNARLPDEKPESQETQE